MRKFIFTFIFVLCAVISFAQMPQRRHQPRHFHMPQVDMTEYCIVDSLPLERITIYSPFDYEEGEQVVKLGESTYLMEMPFTDKMVIAYNKDKSKCIVLYNSYAFGRHKEFNVKETDARIVMWYQDDDLYCGYAYDKRYKVCKYFENFFEHLQDFMKHHELQ